MESRIVPTGDGTKLHVGVTGIGADVVVLSGGPGCVQYLEDDRIAPIGVRAWYPEPRGVGRSGGAAHTMAVAVADLEAIRASQAVEFWTVLGHSWGSDLGVYYALQHPESVTRVIGIAGCDVQKDRTWSEAYHALKHTEPVIPIAWEPAVHAALSEAYLAWIHEPHLLRQLADSPIPMTFIAPALDIRPSWPLEQLAALVPKATFKRVSDVPHDLWTTHPDVWVRVVTASLLPP
jgi:proline iminopeptidase